MLGLDIRSLKNHLLAEEHSTFVITSKRSMIVSEQQEHPRVLRPPRGKLFSLFATYHIKTHGLWMSLGGWRHCRIMQLQFQLLLGEIMIQLMRPQNQQFIDVHSMANISPTDPYSRALHSFSPCTSASHQWSVPRRYHMRIDAHTLLAGKPQKEQAGNGMFARMIRRNKENQTNI